MEHTLAVWRTNREKYASLLDAYTLDQLNKIPDGFRNNIIWNIAHVVVTQQLLVYNLSGLPMMVDAGMVDRYKRGTAPEHDVTEDEVARIRELLTSTIDQTEQDLAANSFQDYKAYTTSTGFHIGSAHDAIGFNNYHEGMHFGIIMGLRKFV